MLFLISVFLLSWFVANWPVEFSDFSSTETVRATNDRDDDDADEAARIGIGSRHAFIYD